MTEENREPEYLGKQLREIPGTERREYVTHVCQAWAQCPRCGAWIKAVQFVAEDIAAERNPEDPAAVARAEAEKTAQREAEAHSCPKTELVLFTPEGAA